MYRLMTDYTYLNMYQVWSSIKKESSFYKYNKIFIKLKHLNTKFIILIKFGKNTIGKGYKKKKVPGDKNWIGRNDRVT